MAGFYMIGTSVAKELRHIDVTENFGLRETERWKRFFSDFFFIFQIWKDFYKKSYEKITLFMTYFKFLWSSAK